jgi:hypothetical protein
MWFKPAEHQQPKHPPIATTATTATKPSENPSLSQKSRKSQAVRVSPAQFNQSENVAAGLKATDRQKLLDYLAAIGETDQDIINEYLTECGKDAETLARELQQAGDCLQIKTGDYTGLVQCTGCHYLAGDTCNRFGWRVVVDKWRRCIDHGTTPEIITCKPCGHFQSFNNHGGGAGACGAGVMPFGACWWADTVHECDKYQALEAGK